MFCVTVDCAVPNFVLGGDVRPDDLGLGDRVGSAGALICRSDIERSSRSEADDGKSDSRSEEVHVADLIVVRLSCSEDA